jgi:hypothetical protein
MQYDYKKYTDFNISLLQELRKYYSLDKYPKAVLWELFNDLYALPRLWLTVKITISKNRQFESFEIAQSRVASTFNSCKEDNTSVYKTSFERNEQIGNLRPSNFSNYLQEACRGNNKALEELEFAFVVRGQIVNFFTAWFGAILTGYDKEKAYQLMVNNISLTVNDWDSFDEVFLCFGDTILFETAGTETASGKILLSPLYELLPPFYNSFQSLILKIKHPF